MNLQIKHLTYSKLGEIAQNFLTKYYSKSKTPIPIELIAERELGIEILPVVNMKPKYDIESCLASSLKTIFIDYYTYMNIENRARFSLAHEVGHIVLHSEIFKFLDIKSEEDSLNLVGKIRKDDYGWLEYQAYAFAGHILVPREYLLKEIKDRLGEIPSNKFLPEEIFPISQELLDTFNVSGDVLSKRLIKEGVIRANNSL